MGLPEQPPSLGKTQLNLLELRRIIDEYVAAVHDTMKALHNRCGCTIDNPCAYCRRRMKAEAELLGTIGRKSRSTWFDDELAARLCAADTSKKM